GKLFHSFNCPIYTYKLSHFHKLRIANRKGDPMMAILFTSLYFLFSLPMNIDIPASIQTDLHTTISNDEEHLTNEKYKDKAELHGTYLTEGSSFLKDVSLSITHHTNKKWHIALKEGYDPSITFIDITNNGKKDILYKVALNKERTI